MPIAEGWQRFFPADLVARWKPRTFALPSGAQTQLVSLGEGPPIIAVPPIIGWKETFLRQAPFFARRRRFITFDLREPARGTPLRWDGFLDDITAVADAEAPEPFVLLGHSLGGAAALSWTLAHPHRVRALVLSSTFARVHFHPSVWWNRFGAQGVALAASALPREASLAVARAMARANLWVYDRHCDETMLEFIRWAVRHSDARTLRRRVRLALGVDLRARLAEVRVPSLVLWGGAEPPYTRRAGEDLARGIAGASHAVVPGANHLAPLTNPRAFNEIVEAWLDR